MKVFVTPVSSQIFFNFSYSIFISELSSNKIKFSFFCLFPLLISVSKGKSIFFLEILLFLRLFILFLFFRYALGVFFILGSVKRNFVFICVCFDLLLFLAVFIFLFKFVFKKILFDCISLGFDLLVLN